MTWKVFNPKGEWIAECRHAEDAACLVAAYGEGAKIKKNGKVVWDESNEDFAAEESYDQVAAVCHRRAEENAK